MKKLVRIILTVLFSVLATTPQAVANSVSPYSINALEDGTSTDPSQGTADPGDIFQDIASLEEMEDGASEFIAPAWLEILVLVSPANYPISTFLTQKSLDGIRGLAKAQAQKGEFADVLVHTSEGDARFNPKYRVNKDELRNYKQFSDEKIKNYKLSWGDIAVLPFQDTITASTSAGTGTTATLTVANIAMWKRSQNLKVHNAEYADPAQSLVLYVRSATPTTGDAGTIVVQSTVTDTNGDLVNIPAITANSRCTRMGTVAAELDVKNDAIAQKPTSDYNYAQKFITSVVYSNRLMMTQLFTNYSYSMVTNLALQDFRYGQEMSFMFGQRSQYEVPNATATGNETVNQTGGLEFFIDQVVEYPSTITESDIVDFTETMRVGNNGADKRFLFAGSKTISALNKGVMSQSTRFVQKEYDTVYGLSFTSLYSFFGTIYVTYAPLLDQSDYINKGFLLDMDYIDKFVFQPFSETQVDLKKLREADAHSIDMMEECGLVARNIDTHYIFGEQA